MADAAPEPETAEAWPITRPEFAEADALEEADHDRYVATCSVDSNVRSNVETLKEFGLCDFHSYTMMQCLAVKLHPKGKTHRYLI